MPVHTCTHTHTDTRVVGARALRGRRKMLPSYPQQELTAAGRVPVILNPHPSTHTEGVTRGASGGLAGLSQCPAETSAGGGARGPCSGSLLQDKTPRAHLSSPGRCQAGIQWLPLGHGHRGTMIRVTGCTHCPYCSTDRATGPLRTLKGCRLLSGSCCFQAERGCGPWAQRQTAPS